MIDPAMGSGHFLVEAVDFITERLLKFLSGFPTNPVSFHLEQTRTRIMESLGEQGVTVDSDKLIDINLLKRHVLKRCIYGVDLNPMAVELAKVSLWLDAFTLGAPLSFLDHHLRCGNSLVGATFKDLEGATSGRLFHLDYEPMLRAINYVLLVSKDPDATAAEVARSVTRYDQARRDLSGYQVVLDLLVAGHFGLPKARELVTEGSDLTLDDRERFLKSLHDDKERRLVAQVEELARRPDLRFFHWEIEFPEVFFGLMEGTAQQIRHKDKIAPGSAGFDVVIGNPPYVRQETIKPYKAFLKETFATYDSTNDLYVYFQEQEVRQLHANGRMGMIVANKWMRAGYGERLRDFLQRVGRPLEVIDFGHSPIFPDADTFPCILIVTKRARVLTEKEQPGADEKLLACEVPREHWSDRMDLGAFVFTRRQHILASLLRKEGWSLENPKIQALMERIRAIGIPLKDYCGTEIYRGPVTGLNEAFFIDASTRNRLITEDRRAAELIKPMLRGRDIDRWRPRYSDAYMIFSRRGTDLKRYPSIHRYLAQFRERLEPRPKDWDERRGKWAGRRPGDYRWFEMQDPFADEAVSAMFQGQKVVWQDLAFHSRFCLDTQGHMVNDLCFFINSKNKYPLGILNSRLMWGFLSRTVIHGKDEVLRLKAVYMDVLPIPIPSEESAAQIELTVDSLVKCIASLEEWGTDLLGTIQDRFGPQENGSRVLTWLTLPQETFANRVFKAVGIDRPSSRDAQELMATQRKGRSRQVELLAHQLELEKRLTTLVEDAYGLTSEERALLHATRPVRDPLDVLEAKIRGEVTEEAPAEG